MKLRRPISAIELIFWIAWASIIFCSAIFIVEIYVMPWLFDGKWPTR